MVDIQKAGDRYRVRLAPASEIHLSAEDLADLHAKSGQALALDHLATAHDGSGAVHFPAEIERDARCEA